MKRVVIIVLDGVGVGPLPDADQYGDEGSNTLGNLSVAAGGLNIPCLEGMGLGNIGDFKGVKRVDDPVSSYGRMLEHSKGKDTITGHWEMMGIINERPFPTYPRGFPEEIVGAFEKEIGKKILGNKAASGTEIIKELGHEHMRTGAPIVYTSGDSVFQIAAHEDVIPVDELYRMCEAARRLLRPPHNVCRVIARPFIGPPFERTPRRRDFALPPPGETVLDMLVNSGKEVISVGKVADMFAGRGFTGHIKASSNRELMEKTAAALGDMGEGLVFSNLVDFDTLYGHRNDTAGFKRALEEFDLWLSSFLHILTAGDYLFITADHGCDPTTPSTDHSREYVPLLFYNKTLPARDLGTRDGFLDIGATVCDIFGMEGARPPAGKKARPPAKREGGRSFLGYT